MFSVASLGRPQYEADMTSAQIRPAGLVTKLNESAQQCCSWEQRPPTPPEQRKYRMLSVHEPGKIARHYGAADDPIPEGPFGVVHRNGESVAEQLANYPTTDMARWQLEQSEDIYASTKREPLGRGYQRGTRIPAGMGTDRPFGMVVDAQGKERARQALHIMFPTDQPPDAVESTTRAHDMYIRSHAAYLPGEQKNREYDWQRTGVDPTTHRFGAVDKNQYRDGVRKALHPGLDQTLQQPAVISSKIHTDFKLSNTDQLGKTKKLGTGERNLAPDHTFGMPSLRHGVRGATVEELLKHSLPMEQQQPDADLGKSLREGYRNIAPEDRVFGAPSIRTDIPAPTKRSVSSTVNYGNEPDALQLLRPPKSVERGVHEAHYMEMRPKDDVQAIVNEADIPLTDDQFDVVFKMASEADGEANKCCLDTFFRARHHVLSQQTL